MSDEEETPSPEETPSNDVELTSDEISKYVDFINGRAVAPSDACQVCGSDLNYVNEYVYKLDTLKEAAVLGGRVIPLIVTICVNCSFVRMFSRNVADANIAAEAANEPQLDLPQSDPPEAPASGSDGK